MSITKRKQLTEFLIKELKSKELVKDFSETLRQLGLLDLKKDEDLECLGLDSGVYLLTLLTFYQFGILRKLADIKQRFDESLKQQSKK